MIVEFFGPPGSGKTTLTRALIQSNPEHIVRPQSTTEGLSKVQILTRILSPPALILWFRLLPWKIQFIRKNGFSVTGRRLYLYTTVLYLETRKYAKMNLDPKVHILYDQNICNLILSWLYLQEDVSEKEIQRILDYFLPYMQKYLILVGQIDLESNLARLRNRADGHSRFDLFQGDDQQRKLQTLHANFAHVLRVIETNNLKHIHVDMNNSIEDNVAKICQELARYENAGGALKAEGRF